MAIFKFKALNSEGKKVDGLIDAANEKFAAETLQERGLSIISIKKHSEGRRESRFLSVLDRVKTKDLVIFSRQFSVMISANVALVQALRILIEQTENITLKMIVSEMADEVDGGLRLSDSLAKRPKIFSDFYINVVKSGETSGKLDEVLNYLADEMEKDYDMTSKIRGAMIYPIFVLVGLGVVGVVMMVFVVPKLTGILSETGATLPLVTRILIGTSDFLAAYWWLLAVVLVILAIGLRFYVKTSRGKKQFDFFRLKVPIFGKLFQRIYLVRFTRSMNTLITGGVTITKSLKITSEVVGNEIYKDLIEKTSQAVEAGDSISGVFAESEEIPKMVSQMMAIGEKTGKLDIILARITDFYTREINNVVANLMTLMEPIIMIIMGIAVGIMVAAIILPMYNLASQF
ncbi:MAG: type II secretion system F family protein [Patescibacteria group bacterium]|nr:type II secretion system F family protein [Patescibacteria group bacterium]